MKLLLSLLLVTCAILNADVTEVRLTWHPALCNDVCIRNLDKQFRRIDALQEININQKAGQAILKYKPGASYNFVPINTAMQLIGLSINNIHIRVSGLVKATERDVFLVSDGGSVFTLKSNFHAPSAASLENYNPANNKLDDQTRNKLLEATKGNKLVTISGELFAPERSPPSFLIVQDFKGESDKK